ncbi:UvrD-helicase domain-containing protein [Weeksellaceae bacterium TAE3-ERU29]|nr:UvrD-helicase domain-containing protein [Weeksellaceae bacterium TAE3-ERU29]
MLQPNDFKIYNASAGAGKTYTLVQEFLYLLLSKKDPMAFSQILAITFTNKAANEMKERILEKLKEWTNGEISEAEQTGLKNHLGLEKNEVQQKAKKVLTTILHNYSLFSVSTIDTFNLRLMRAFSQDLGLSVNFDVEMNVSELMEEAVNLLYADLQNHKLLTDTVSEIALENLGQDKRWDISFQVAQNAVKMYSDHFTEYMEGLNKLSLEELVEFRKKVRTKFFSAQKKAEELSQEILDLIKSKGLDFADFAGGARSGLPNFFKKITEKKYDFPTNTHFKNLTEKKYASGKATQTASLNIEEIFPKIEESVNQVLHYLVEINIWSKIYKTINSLSLYNEVEKKLKELKNENNVMLISEFNKIISQHIQEQPIPFIYEKIGTRYHHYFIDEFQDTSTLQWQNLNPLVDNALSQSDTVMLVGDPKQSIYRWRGGNSQLMIDLINNTENQRISVENLETNWRSFDEIINFNNDFYTFIAEYIQDKEFKEIYKIGNQQKANPKKGGFVHLQILEKEEDITFSEQALNQLLEKIKFSQQNGFRWKDMAVLVRARAEGNKVAEFLKENEIEVLSDEALLLNNNAEIQLLLSLFKLMTEVENPTFRINFLLHLKRLNILKIDDFTNFSLSVKNITFNDFLLELRALGLDLSFLNLPMKSLYDQTEQSIQALGLNKNNQSYLLYFLDEVLQFQNKNESSAQSFLEYWELNGEKKSITVPEGIDAIKLMTIHKSKGLQFPVVFLPFATFSSKTDGVWIPINDDKISDFYIEDTKNHEYLPEPVKNIIEGEINNSLMDVINMLYVATTRAEEQLYMFTSPLGKSAKSISTITFMNDFINQNSDNSLIFEKGNPERKSKIKSDNLDNQKYFELSTSDWTEKVRISNEHAKLWEENIRESQDYGKKIHAVLEQINTINDLDSVLNDFYLQGFINQQEKTLLNDRINEVFNHSILNKAFTNIEALNERDFIDENGFVFRPDRLVKTENGWFLLDYKTGEELKSHISQITKYRNNLNNLGINIAKTYLVYLTNELKVLEV